MQHDPKRIADRYVVESQLGRGGMGMVAAVHDEVSGERLALKLLQAGASGRVRLGFEQEYRTLVGLRHPNIVRVYAYGFHGELPFYTMELLDGRDMLQAAPMPYREACAKLSDVASALALLHMRGLVHRDVTPRNVRAGKDGRVRLIDFGGVETVGTMLNVLGTPAYMAPEAFGKATCDARTDLYSLGATAYFLLTGRDAYPARKLDELPAVWEREPQPPSALISEVPAALDELVMSMLQQDRSLRPISAAEVIERFVVIAELARKTQWDVASSYLASSALVGRSKAEAVATRLLVRANRREACGLLIRGDSGVGRTRLLTELGTHAELMGAAVVKLSPPLSDGVVGMGRAVAAQLLKLCPTPALEQARPWAPVLAHLPEFRGRLGVDKLAELSEVPGERNLRLSAAIEGWLDALARTQFVVIAVDDAEQLDAASVVWLAGVARSCEGRRFCLLVAERSSPAGRPLAIAHLERVELTPLPIDATRELVTRLFGGADNAERLVAWLSEHGLGNPLHMLELLRKLLERGALHYTEGTWVLPETLPSGSVSTSLESALLERLHGLSDDARRVAEALSVARGSQSLDQCVALCGLVRAHIESVLLELCTFGVLTQTSDGYSFTHELLRAAVELGLPEERKRALHVQIADTLLAQQSDSLSLRLDAVHHLLRAGMEERAIDHALSFAGHPRMWEHWPRRWPVLVQVYEASVRLRRSAKQQFIIGQQLAQASYYGAPQLAARFGPEVVALGERVCGLSVAAALRRYVGRRASVLIGLAYAGFAGLLDPRTRRFGLKKTIEWLVGCVMSLMGTAVCCLDLQGARAYGRSLEPLDGMGNALSAALAICRLMPTAIEGRHAGTLATAERWLERLTNPRDVKDIDATARTLYTAGLLYTLTAIESTRDEPIKWLAELERLDIELYRMVACELRARCHLVRGELAEARTERQRADLIAARMPSAWQSRLTRTFGSAYVYFELYDVVSVKRIATQLEELPLSTVGARRAARIVQGELCLLRGDPQQAVAHLEPIWTEERPFEQPWWPTMMAQLTSAYNAAGQHEKAKQACEYALSLLGEADLDFAGNFGLMRELSVAEAALGHTGPAIARMDGLLALHSQRKGPVTIGHLHKTRAEVALLMRDRDAFEKHFCAMLDCFEPLCVPGLQLACQRLAAQGSALGLLRSAAPRRKPSRNHQAELAKALAFVDHGSERAQRLIAWTLGQTGAAGACLYAWDGSVLRELSCAGSVQVTEPLHRALTNALERTAKASPVSYTAEPWGPTTELREEAQGDFHTSLLSVDGSGQRHLVGALVLALGAEPVATPSADLLHAIATAMHSAPAVEEAAC